LYKAKGKYNSKIEVIQVPVGTMANFTYILADRDTAKACVIDPSWDLEKLFEILKRNNWNLEYIINTHTHFDHILGNEQVASVTGAKIIQHENSNQPSDKFVKDEEIVYMGNIPLKILYTPGHSNDSICIVIEDKFIFTGDTIFVGNCGRVDLPGGDAKKLYNSIFNVISKLDESLIVYPGHNYGSYPTSTIKEEKKTSPIFSPRTEEDFVKFMYGDD
jgi:hydroxyacylglutathione hydrolase